MEYEGEIVEEKQRNLKKSSLLCWGDSSLSKRVRGGGAFNGIEGKRWARRKAGMTAG